MATHRLSTTVTTSAGTVVTNGQTFTEDGHTSLDFTLATGQLNIEHVLDVDISEVVSYIMTSDQDVLIETNSATVPDDTFTLPADEALIWNTDSLYTSLITADISTNIFVSNASGSLATVKMRFLFDALP